MRERMKKLCSKRFSTHEASSLPSETLVQGTESSVQLAETSTVVVTTPASEVFPLMLFTSISGHQGITFMHSGKGLVVLRQMMRLKTLCHIGKCQSKRVLYEYRILNCTVHDSCLYCTYMLFFESCMSSIKILLSLDVNYLEVFPFV